MVSIFVFLIWEFACENETCKNSLHATVVYVHVRAYIRIIIFMVCTKIYSYKISHYTEYDVH